MYCLLLWINVNWISSCVVCVSCKRALQAQQFIACLPQYTIFMYVYIHIQGVGHSLLKTKSINNSSLFLHEKLSSNLLYFFPSLFSREPQNLRTLFRAWLFFLKERIRCSKISLHECDNGKFNAAFEKQIEVFVCILPDTQHEWEQCWFIRTCNKNAS